MKFINANIDMILPFSSVYLSFTIGCLILFEVSSFFHLHFWCFLLMQKCRADFSYYPFLPLRSKKYSSFFPLLFLFQNLYHLNLQFTVWTSFSPTFCCSWKLFLFRLLVSYIFAVKCKNIIVRAQVYSFWNISYI